MLSCQHTLNVKGLVWQSESQGYSWIIDSHSTLQLLFLWLCIARGRSLHSKGFYGDVSQHKARLCFSSLLKVLAHESPSVEAFLTFPLISSSSG